MLYADDVMLLAEREDGLQFMLNILDRWCTGNKMVVNCKKSQIVHFRSRSIPRSIFFCSNVAHKILI